VSFGATDMLFAAAITLAALGAILVGAGIGALVRRRPMRFTVRVLAGLLLLSLGTLAGVVASGTQGYRALTREDVVAHVVVLPQGAQRFKATLRYRDGGEQTFALAGDEIYIDAHIIKWKPPANLFGLHTAYELDRVGGRYREIEQERTAPRTVHALAHDRLVDLFGLRQRYAVLSALFDAEYGSATFVPVTRPALLEVRVSTSGLLVREADARP
jgi:hypothetical protein